MATAFDGIGMGMLGSEKNYMGGGGSDIKFLLGSLLKKGLDGKSNVPLPAWPAFEDNQSTAVAPPSQSSAVAPPNANQTPAETSNDDHPETTNVLKDLGLSSFLKPDLFKARDPNQDQIPQQTASIPPAPLQLPQYGGSGSDVMNIISTLGSLFV